MIHVYDKKNNKKMLIKSFKQHLILLNLKSKNIPLIIFFDKKGFIIMYIVFVQEVLYKVADYVLVWKCQVSTKSLLTQL